MAASQAYESKAAARNGIESVQKNAPGAAVDDQT
ncbi:YegP family protein [Nocardia brasiliensis]